MSKLLHWVSNVQQTSNNNENARTDSNANTDASKTPPVKKKESLFFVSELWVGCRDCVILVCLFHTGVKTCLTSRCLTFQVSVEEMVTKKEQVAEALRATQMILNKHSEK